MYPGNGLFVPMPTWLAFTHNIGGFAPCITLKLLVVPGSITRPELSVHLPPLGIRPTLKLPLVIMLAAIPVLLR
jgi:hypothetical protein